LAAASCAKMLGQNHFAEPNWLILTFLHPKFAVQCTGGVAPVISALEQMKCKSSQNLQHD
jgi:hypothetical protein